MGLMDGKVGLVVGIANERSYAWYIAESLKAEGARLAFTHLPGEKNERRTRRAVEALGIADPWLVPLNAGSDAELDEAFAKYSQAFGGRMDYLVHSIAFAETEWLQFGKFVETPRSAYLSAIDISAYTLVAMAKRARPMMQASGGSIICMSYYGAEKVVPGYNVMGVAKAALEASTRYLAAELGGDKIRVNAISGGYLRTLAASAVQGTDTMGTRNAERAPLRRNVEGGDVGKTALYLLSDLSSGVTGETIYVDCGVNLIGV